MAGRAHRDASSHRGYPGGQPAQPLLDGSRQPSPHPSLRFPGRGPSRGPPRAASRPPAGRADQRRHLAAHRRGRHALSGGRAPSVGAGPPDQRELVPGRRRRDRSGQPGARHAHQRLDADLADLLQARGHRARRPSAAALIRPGQLAPARCARDRLPAERLRLRPRGEGPSGAAQRRASGRRSAGSQRQRGHLGRPGGLAGSSAADAGPARLPAAQVPLRGRRRGAHTPGSAERGRAAAQRPVLLASTPTRRPRCAASGHPAALAS